MTNIISKNIFSIIVLTVIAAVASAETKPVRGNSEMAVNCYSKVRSSALDSQIRECKNNGTASTYTLTTLGNEQAIIISGNKGMKCVITEKLAKQNRVPFGLLVEMITGRRIDLQCAYELPRQNENGAASSFSIRAFLE